MFKDRPILSQPASKKSHYPAYILIGIGALIIGVAVFLVASFNPDDTYPGALSDSFFHKTLCQVRGGTWKGVTEEVSYWYTCLIGKTTDAGKTCSTDTDCQGHCIAVRTPGWLPNNSEPKCGTYKRGIEGIIWNPNWNQNSNTNTNANINSVACTMEAKLCPDGSAVGRIPPNCEFAPCPDVNSLLTETEAREIAEASCIKGGESLAAGIYNESSKTWWYDANLNSTREGCNPACVVDEQTRTAEINWRCTGLIEPQ